MSLSFDEWHRLSESDPAEFVAARRAAIDAHIDSVPTEYKARLRLLQNQVDMLRATTPSANKMMQLISEMLVERVAALEQASTQLFEISKIVSDDQAASF
ncbi:MAG: DUF3135 domain-containing protein [Betaproteobacteria bacterium]|nr:DUF3135 domain-containing protein [Betaproteobacteria bacterium]